MLKALQHPEDDRYMWDLLVGHSHYHPSFGISTSVSKESVSTLVDIRSSPLLRHLPLRVLVGLIAYPEDVSKLNKIVEVHVGDRLAKKTSFFVETSHWMREKNRKLKGYLCENDIELLQAARSLPDLHAACCALSAEFRATQTEFYDQSAVQFITNYLERQNLLALCSSPSSIEEEIAGRNYLQLLSLVQKLEDAGKCLRLSRRFTGKCWSKVSFSPNAVT